MSTKKVKKPKKEKVKKEKKPLFAKKEKKVKVEDIEEEASTVQPKKKKKSYAWVFMLILLFAQLALYAVVVYGGYDGFMRIAFFALAIFAAIINLFVIFNSR